MNTIKSAFIHIPKTGGTTLINTPLYANYHWKEIEDHSTILENEENNSRIFDNVFTYTIMRNPFERMVSLYSFRKKQGDLYIHANLFDSDIGPDGKVWDFNRWIKSPEMKGTTIEGLKSSIILIILASFLFMLS